MVSRTEEQAKYAASVVDYEVQQLFLTYAAQMNRGLFGAPINNAVLESFLLHYRNLRDFFSSKNPRSDDITVTDFLEDPNTQCQSWTEIAPREKERLDRSLAHLSHSRFEYEEDKHWPLAEMLRAIMTRLEQLLAQLPDDRKRWFEQSASALQVFRNLPSD